MSCDGGIGDIEEISRFGTEELTVVWRIRDFPSLLDESDDDYWHMSPVFRLGDESFFLNINLKWKDKIRRPASEWMSLSLIRLDHSLPKSNSLRISLGIRGSAGVERSRTGEEKFFRYGNYNWSHSCTRSELVDLKTKLVPGGVLTIRCVVKTCGAAKDESEDGEDRDEEDEDESSLDDSASGSEEDDEDSEGEENAKEQNLVRNGKKISLPARHENVIRSLKANLSEGNRADFTLKSGGREWPVHRAILEGRSKHFETFFRAENWAEKDEVQLDNVSERALESVLHFIYTGEVPNMSVENVLWLYFAAYRFLLEDLKSLCIQYMEGSMCPELVCDALVIAKLSGEGDLKESALECYFRESGRVVATKGWMGLKENHPAIIGELFQEFIQRERNNQRN